MKLKDFNFDQMSLLAVTDSAAFEELRSALIKNTVQFSGANTNLLTKLQCRLDQEIGTGFPRYLSCLHFSTWLNETYQQLETILE